MTHDTRRDFLKRTGAAGLTIVAGSAARTYAANEQISVGLIGCGIRGMSFVGALPGVRAVCDPDRQRIAAAAKKFNVDEENTGTDLRRILDDKSIDAVFIATPDHWHAPAGIMACDAGKHAYVEKPCSHNIREGRLLLDAARRNRVVVQHGTQSRSSQFITNGIQMLREGIIGDVLVAKAWNIQRRQNIGHAKPTDPPPHVDYDMWVGPAEWEPYQENRLHYHWHWTYSFGGGGSGGDGPHEIDYARWGLGVETHPSRAAALGGIFYFDDDRDHCDTQMAVFNYPGDGEVGSQRQLIYEQRLWSLSYPYNVDSGAEFYGTAGRMFLSKRGKLDSSRRPKPTNRQPAAEGTAAVGRQPHPGFLRCNPQRPSSDCGHRDRTPIGHAGTSGKYRNTHPADTPLRSEDRADHRRRGSLCPALT